MSSYGIIELDGHGPNLWLDLVEECVAHDVYHLPFYHTLSEKIGEGRPYLFFFRDEEVLICLPFLLRQIDQLPELSEIGAGYRDATSVYGYAGPISSTSKVPPVALGRFQKALGATLHDLHVVSVFSRLHPILQNRDLLFGLGSCKEEGYTVSIDTTRNPTDQFAEFRRNHRVDIASLRRMGLRCREANTPGDLEVFVSIYSMAMKRVDASRAYFLPRWWFDQFLGTTEATTRLFLVEYQDQTACGALVTLCHGLVEIHLAATADSFVPLSPLKLLFDEVRGWAVNQGAGAVHLGGGIGARSDSLFQFKSGFSRRRHSFYTWQWVLDQETYYALASVRVGQEIDRYEPASDSFFPAYRASLSREDSSTAAVAGQAAAESFRVDADIATDEAEELTKQVVASPLPRTRVVIVGAGGHARVIADAILTRASKHRIVDVVGFVDDDPALNHKRFNDIPVLGKLSDISRIPHDEVVIGIGDNQVRRQLFLDLRSKGEKIATVIHPSATIARDVRIGRGTVAFAGVVVNTGAVIGDNVILNTGCTVDHDCRIKSHVHICPGAHLGGTVSVGEGAFVGIGSTIIQNKNIGEWSVVGGGAAVIKNVLPRTTVVGVPSRVLRKD